MFGAISGTLNKQIVPADLVESEVIRYKSFDGLDIPALLFKPRRANIRNKVPALVFAHGAPGGQTRKVYRALFQYLVNHGYGVLAVNQRSSQGYGKTFFSAAKRRYGREPLWDVVESKRYLQSLDYINSNKIGIIGESGGGYMVLAALAFSLETFASGVDIFGVTNWISLLESIPPQWGALRQSLFNEFDAANVDKRRASLGMEPLEEYLNAIRRLSREQEERINKEGNRAEPAQNSNSQNEEIRLERTKKGRSK